MKTLEHSFNALALSGLWRPMHWVTGWRARSYVIWTFFTMFVLVSFVVAQFVEMMNTLDDVETIANNSFLVMTLVADCGKAANVLIKRGDIIELIERLRKNPCRPNSDEEISIQRKFDYAVRFNLLRFTAASGFTVFALISRSLAQDIPRRSLPFNVWLPFDSHDSSLGYWIAYVHQMLGICISCGVGVAFDCFVPALMLQTCAQLNILKHRFVEMPKILCNANRDDSFKDYDRWNFFKINDETKLIAQRVEHHLEIFKFAEKMNDLFGLIIFLQYSLSTLIICACMVELAHVEITSPSFVVLFVYIAEMSLQIMMYCFYGGEVMIESKSLCDAVYEMDWTELSVNSKRSLVTIMIRTTRPITFTSGHILVMNLESFKSLLKLSYSTFNVLQTTQG